MQEILTIEQNVDLIKLDSRSIYLVGTAHISKESNELVERILREAAPDTVAVELCEARYQSLMDPERWKNTDIVDVIKQGKVYILMAQLCLASFQKRLGAQLGSKPGEEMLRSIAIGKELNSSIILADRDVKTTLKRIWRSLSFFGSIKLVLTMLESLFSRKEIAKDEIERMKNSDVFAELLGEFSSTFPSIRRTLIDERDEYLAFKIAGAPGKTVVAVVGAGHVPGIKQFFGKPLDITSLETIPPPTKTSLIVAWIIPGIFFALIISGFLFSGFKGGIEMLTKWVWINSFFAGLGALIALAHPLTIIAAALSAPITAAHPFLGSGLVAGFVEACIRKPKVSDFENIADDLSSLKGIWKNRLSRIFLVIILSSITGSIGTIIALTGIWSLI